MLEFFLHYIAPKSPARAKLSIHLHARGVSEISPLIEKVTSEVRASEQEGIDRPRIDSKPVEHTNGDARKQSAPEPYLIQDIRDFRSRLVVSAGPQPVKDLSEFEELDSKL